MAFTSNATIVSGNVYKFDGGATQPCTLTISVTGISSRWGYAAHLLKVKTFENEALTVGETVHDTSLFALFQTDFVYF
jgi:hypothetical protein